MFVDGKVLFVIVLIVLLVAFLAATGASVTPNVFVPLTYETDDYEVRAPALVAATQQQFVEEQD